MNETSAPPLTNINGTLGIPADNNIDGISIADQLVEAHKSWKSYQEGLPNIGADGVNVSDGYYTIGGVNSEGANVTSDFTALSTTGNPVSSANVVYLYAVKHNPFAYFASVQEGASRDLSLHQVVAFDGQQGLYADLKAGRVPDLAFIAPNQCDDMHGRGNGTAFCNFDADDNGTQQGLNPSLILQGDLALQRIVTAIKASPVWSDSRSAIVVVWDENDYSTHHQQSGGAHRRHQLRSAWAEEWQVLRPLFAHQDARWRRSDCAASITPAIRACRQSRTCSANSGSTGSLPHGERVILPPCHFATDRLRPRPIAHRLAAVGALGRVSGGRRPHRSIRGAPPHRPAASVCRRRVMRAPKSAPARGTHAHRAPGRQSPLLCRERQCRCTRDPRAAGRGA